MKSVFIIIVSIIILAGLIGGLFAYSYNQLSISLNDVKLHSIELEQLTWSALLKLGLNTLSGDWMQAVFEVIHGINLNLTLELHNNGLLPVYIPNFSYDIFINDILIGEGTSNVDTIIYPGQVKEIVSLQNIQKSSLAPSINSIIITQEIIDLKVKGTAYFQLLGLSIPIPFESTKQIFIFDEIQSKVNEIMNN